MACVEADGEKMGGKERTPGKEQRYGNQVVAMQMDRVLQLAYPDPPLTRDTGSSPMELQPLV